MNKLLAGALVSIGLTAATTSLTMAQNATPSATPGTQTQQGVQGRGHHEFKMPSERTEARLDFLWKKLGITSAQEPQWNAFASTLRKQAAQRDARVQEWRAQAQSGQRPHLSAVAKLERHQQFLTAAAANANEVLAVQKPLYAVLSDEQKQIADKYMVPGGGRHMHHRGGFHRGA